MQKIKNNRFEIIIGIVLLAGFLVYININHFEKLPHVSTRTELPQIQTSSGTVTLITEPDQGTLPLLSLIKDATKSIDIVIYEFKDKDIGDALIAAQKRGVAVRVLVNQGYYGKEEPTNEPAFAYMASNGIAVHWTPTSFALTHQKTLIVDGAKAVIMTFNFVPKYYATSRDFGVVTTNLNDVTAIENTFNNDWQNKKEQPSKGDDLVWSPGSEKDMLLIITNAKKTLKIYNEEMNDPTVTAALIASAKRKVAVQVVMTYTSKDRPVFTQLKNGGVQIHTYKNSKKNIYIHAKMILSDDTYAFVGSENFSPTSLDKNRELGIFLSDSAIIASLSSTFTHDWQNGTEF